MGTSKREVSGPVNARLQASRWIALVGGVVLPILETLRRWGTWWDYPPGYVDDWLIGGFLLLGAWAARPANSRRGRPLLAAAWGFACGMHYPSVTAHWYAMRAGQPDPAPIPTEAVFAVKILLAVLAITGLLLALAPQDRVDRTTP